MFLAFDILLYQDKDVREEVTLSKRYELFNYVGQNIPNFSQCEFECIRNLALTISILS